MLTELGAVGLALFALAMVGAFAGAIRARRLGPAAAQISCGALAAGVYWLAHTSIDWFWPYPAVTAAALTLLGAASGPIFLATTGASRPGGRRALIPVVAVFFALLIPPLLSELLVERSFETFRDDPDQAYEDLELARDLNPLSDQPALQRERSRSPWMTGRGRSTRSARRSESGPRSTPGTSSSPRSTRRPTRAWLAPNWPPSKS